MRNPVKSIYGPYVSEPNEKEISYGKVYRKHSELEFQLAPWASLIGFAAESLGVAQRSICVERNQKANQRLRFRAPDHSLEPCQPPPPVLKRSRGI